MSRLLAPTETPIEPEGICHRWAATFQIERSNLDNCIVTVLLWLGARKTLSNPFKLNGADWADAGRVMYNCGIYFNRLETAVVESVFDFPHLMTCDTAAVREREGHGDDFLVEPVVETLERVWFRYAGA